MNVIYSYLVMYTYFYMLVIRTVDTRNTLASLDGRGFFLFTYEYAVLFTKRYFSQSPVNGTDYFRCFAFCCK